MEVHIDNEVEAEEDEEEEEEEVTNVEDLSMLERLRLGIADEGDDDGHASQHEDDILDDTRDTDDDEVRTGPKGKAKRSRVRSPSPPPAATSLEDEGAEAPTADKEAPTADEEDGRFIQVEEGKSVYMRGSATLPEEQGLPVEQRPCITPYGESGWKKVGAGERKYRHVNGILGILIRQHYPGMVTLPGEGNVPEPTRTWDHYKACEDVGVANNFEFHNKVERVFAELWDFYRCEDGKLEEARAVINGHCPKLVHSAMHEAHPLAIRTYMATQGCKSHNKKAGRKLHLEKEKYMQVAPRWCVDKGECGERIVDYWCSKDYRAINKDYKNRREAMLDPPHHQGNMNVMEFGERWASHHSALVPNLFLLYALVHKGPFRSATPYDENDPPTAYTSMTAYDWMEKFKGKAKELKGPEYDVTTEPLDHALVMISGDGRKHGKETIAGGMFPRSSCRSLPEYKARLVISKSSTCQRLHVNARLQLWLRWRLIVPRMVCPLCRCLSNQVMVQIPMDLHMHQAQAAITLVVLQIFEIEYGATWMLFGLRSGHEDICCSSKIT